MLKVGIIGFGFMGKAHFNNYKKLNGVEVAAICDLDPENAARPAGGNINVGGGPDLSGVKVGKQFGIFAKTGCDIVDITLPTYLHDKFAVKAMREGFHVICEKPMALNPAKCKRMIEARNETGRKLMIAQCIQFWPQWQAVRDVAQSGRYGKVLGAHFRRLSPTPTWSWDNWLMDENRSGGAIMDLHVHDADFVHFAFGKPDAVFARGFKNHRGPNSGVDGVTTQYIFENGPVVTAEGNWSFDPGYPFSMQYLITFERATMSCGPDGFRLITADGKEELPQVAEGDGYFQELKYFVDCVANDKPIGRARPEESMFAVEMVLAEKKSLEHGRVVKLK